MSNKKQKKYYSPLNRADGGNMVDKTRISQLYSPYAPPPQSAHLSREISCQKGADVALT